MPAKLKREHNIGVISDLTIREKDVLLAMSTWEIEIDGRVTTYNIGIRLNLSQPTIWSIMNKLRYRGFVQYHKPSMMGIKGVSQMYAYWKINPQVKEILKDYNDNLSGVDPNSAVSSD